MGKAIRHEDVASILADWDAHNGHCVVVYWGGIDTLRCNRWDDEQAAMDFAGGPAQGRVFRVRSTFEEVGPK